MKKILKVLILLILPFCFINNVSAQETITEDTETIIEDKTVTDNIEEETNNNVSLRSDNNTQENSGWQEIDGKTYYIYPDGSKATGWVTIDEEKCFFNDLGQLIEKNALKIVDVSHHQGSIDWEAVKETDVDGAIIRLGYGTSYVTDDPVVDRQWDNYYSGTTEQDLLFGTYLYSYAIDEVSADIEADFVIEQLNKKTFDKNLNVYYALEENPWTENLTKDDYDIIINTFNTKLKDNGYNSQIYTYKSLAESKLSEYGQSLVGWIAQYYDECTYNGTYDGWRYTDSGEVNGIKGTVNLSVFKNNKEYTYEIIKGADSEIVIPTNEDLIIEIDANHELFDKLLIDGEEVNPDNYSVTKGSTVITIYSNYLNTLTTGNHIIDVLFKNDKSVSTTLKVTENKTTNNVEQTSYTPTTSINNPKTKDSIIYYLIIMLISLLGIINLTIISKKSHH